MQYYLRRPVTAARAALPESRRVPEALDGGPVRAHVGRGEALRRLAVELPNLVEAVAAAEEFGQRDTVLTVCRALWPLQLKAGHHDALLPVLRTGAAVADARAPGTRTAGALHAQLAHTLGELRLDDEAGAEAAAAVRDERSAGHRLGLASAVEFLGLVRLRQWRHQHASDCFDEAQEHVERALEAFRAEGEAYNTARALADLAEILLVRDERTAALPLIDEPGSRGVHRRSRPRSPGPPASRGPVPTAVRAPLRPRAGRRCPSGTPRTPYTWRGAGSRGRRGTAAGRRGDGFAEVTLWTTRSTRRQRTRVAQRAASSPTGTRIHWS